MAGLFRRKKSKIPSPNVPSIPTMKLDWMEVARGELGVKEIAGPRANPDIVKYHKSTGGWGSDEVAWCASLINWCLMQCGLSKKNPALALAINWNKFGVKCDLRVGAIVIIKTSIGHHVTFCQGIEEDYFLGLGGNQSNACNISRYKKSQIVGCRWPA